MQYGAGVATFDLWMPLNIGQFMRKIELQPPEQTADYVRSVVKEWVEKRLRAKLKASWAARVRWAKERGIDPSTVEHPSIAGSISSLSRKTIELWLVNAKKRSEKASKAARARWAKAKASPSMGVGAGSPPLVYPPLLHDASVVVPPLPPSSFFGAMVDRIVEGLRPNLPRGAFGGSGKGVPQRTRASKSRETGQGALPICSDERYEPFRNLVMEFWRGQNQNEPDCPWERKDQRALEYILNTHKQLSLETFHRWLIHRAQSENTNPSQLPRRWLRTLQEFSAGPLNPYGRLKDTSVEMNLRVGMPPKEQKW